MRDLQKKNLKKNLIDREEDQGPPPNPYENIEQEEIETNRDMKITFYHHRYRLAYKLLMVISLISCFNVVIYVKYNLIVNNSMKLIIRYISKILYQIIINIMMLRV